MPRRAALALLLAIAAFAGCTREPEGDELSRTEKAAQQLEPAEEPDPYKTGTAAIAEAAETGVDSGGIRSQAPGLRVDNDAAVDTSPSAGRSAADGTRGGGSDQQQAMRRSLSDRDPTALPRDPSQRPDDGGAAAPQEEVPVVEEVDADRAPPADVDAASRAAAESESPAGSPTGTSAFAAFRYPDRPHELDAEGWIAFLAAADQAMQQAIAAQQTGEIDRAAFLESARRISGYKLSAAEALDAAASTPRHEELAVLGKIEALSQLAGLGDRSRANELLTFAAEHSDFASADVARQAAVVLLGFSLNRVSGGLSDPAVLLEQVDAVLREPEGLRLPELIMMERAIETLRREGLEDVAEQVRQRTARAFAASSDASLAMQAWRLGVEGSAQLRSFQEAVSQPHPDLRPLTAAIDGLIDAYPNQWTLAALASEIRNLEYAGKPEAAAATAEAVSRRVDLLTSPQVRRDVAAELDAWQRRTSLLGRRPSLVGLVKTNGEPARLEDFDGKYTLLDFWASWCPTCRDEFARIEKATAELGPRLQVVGINLDADPAAMRQVVEQANLAWPQLRVDVPEGVQPIASTGMAELGVRSLPFNLLLDPQGRVVASQLHGDDLLPRLRELIPQS